MASNVLPLSERSADADPQADWSLPGWLYHDPEFFRVEMARVIRPSWQIVCHDSDVADPGDWRTIDYAGESVIVIRGLDGRVRAFHNICRHRGSRLVDGPEGCSKRLVCPYHAWSYTADGQLAGVPMREDYPALADGDFGLIPVELEAWRGFLFVRLEGGGPGVAAMMAPYDAEIAPYRFEDLRAFGRVTLRSRDVNWKNVADNYSDGLHIAVAHPGLTRMFGRSYRVEAQAGRASCATRRPATRRNAPIRRCCRRCRICRPRRSSAGSITSFGPTSRSTSIRTRSISCSSCRSRPPRR